MFREYYCSRCNLRAYMMTRKFLFIRLYMIKCACHRTHRPLLPSFTEESAVRSWERSCKRSEVVKSAKRKFGDFLYYHTWHNISFDPELRDERK